MREAGVIVRPAGDVITLSPPLIITDGQLDTVIETLHDVLLEVMPV
jgi:adenosylmethionine-8-amino-7-oxononanoate aminotransferase